MTKQVAVFDYGSGNVRSAVNALKRVGVEVNLTSDFSTCLEADGLVVPGVGAFAAVMKDLHARRGDTIIDRRLAGGRAVLGICVGMQILFERGLEHGEDTAGMGEWPGTVEKLPAPILPHMGWSKIQVGQGSQLFSGITDERFYFVHSYGVTADPSGHYRQASRMKPPIFSWATHGEPFIAAVENGPLAATQFHPEKSGDAGMELLRNWTQTF